MTEQDEKCFYTGMIILGLVMQGADFAQIPAFANNLANDVMNYKLKEEEND